MNTTKNKVYRCHFHQEIGSKHGQFAKKGHWKVRISASAPTLPSIPSLKYRDLNIGVYTSELDNPARSSGETRGGPIVLKRAASIQLPGFSQGLHGQSPP